MKYVFLSAFAAVVVAVPAGAQVVIPGQTISSYDVRHGFVLTPTFGSWGGFLRPTVTRWGYSLGPTSAFNTMGQVDFRSQVHGSAPLPLGGGTSSVFQAAGVTGAWATSLASASVSWTGLSYVGQIRAAGSAIAAPPLGMGAAAFANSSAWAQVRMVGVSPWFWLTWPSLSYSTVSGSATASQWVRPLMRDPIIVRAESLGSGKTVSGKLLSIDYALQGGDGDMNFVNGVLSMTGSNLSGFFRLDLPGQFTDMKGTVDLRFANGVFTSVAATGSFAGFGLPTPGSDVNGDFWIWDPDVLVKLFDDLDPEEQMKVILMFRNAGRTTIPEPATWAMLVVGFGLMGAWLRRSRHATQPS